MDAFLFLDLDDTIFQTRRKCPSEQDLTPVGFGRDGSALSFMTPKQRAVFSALDKKSTIIPTTARDLAAFNRVKMQFHHCVILNFGGLVLNPQRAIDQAWFDQMEQRSRSAQGLLDDALKSIDSTIKQHGLTSSARLIGDAGLAFYVVVKNFDRRVQDLQVIFEAIKKSYSSKEAYIHFNDNNLCVIPSYLNKAHAVRHVVQTYIAPQSPSYVTFGMGDSTSDLSFMGECDYMIVPTQSQIGKLRA